MLLNVFEDRRAQLGDAREGAATDYFQGDLGEEALNLIEPASGSTSLK